MAEALRDWLPLVLYYAKPWVSGKDIQAGERWSLEVGKVLEESNFGILCLTKDNLNAPWMLFEAGALSKAISTAAVCPYILDAEFRDITGPLSQFQSKKTDRSSTLELLQAMNARAAEPIEEPRLIELFRLLWPKLEKELGEIPEAHAQGAEQKVRPEAEVLEELVASVRTIDRRFSGLEGTVNRILETAASMMPLPPIETAVRPTRPIGSAREEREARPEEERAVYVVVRVNEETPQAPVGSILTVQASTDDPWWFLNELKKQTGVDLSEEVQFREWQLYDPRTQYILSIQDIFILPSYFNGRPPLLELRKGLR